MADYTKMKNADLETLLKERNLAHTGKKAELIKRLQDDDAAGSKPAAATESKVEDEIDWDDEPVATDAKAATSEPAAAAMKAGGQGQPPNPQAVPNQVADIDPSQTNDLKVEAAPTTAADSAGNGDATVQTTTAPAEKEKTPVDFTSGLKATTLEEEIEKRKARAKKFGLDESSDEALKALERAKKFGGTELSSKLNQALPERREKKRGRENDDQTEERKRGRPGMSGRRGSNRRDQPRSSTPRSSAPRNNGAAPPGLSDADRQKAEARKARFASAT